MSAHTLKDRHIHLKALICRLNPTPATSGAQIVQLLSRYAPLVCQVSRKRVGLWVMAQNISFCPVGRCYVGENGIGSSWSLQRNVGTSDQSGQMGGT